MATVEFITMATIMIIGLIVLYINFPMNEENKEVKKLERILAQPTLRKIQQEANK